MARREQITKSPEARKKEQASEETVAAVGVVATEGATKTGEELIAQMDDLLDEIDEVLEVNAEEFVIGYVQKGGE